MQWAVAQPGTMRVGDAQLVFALPDDDGARGVSAGVASHWLRSALAAASHSVSSFVQDHGWLPTGEPPKLAAEVWSDRSIGWLKVGDDVFQLSFEDGTLRGDEQTLESDALTAEDQSTVRNAIERRLCPCPMCEMLRPDREFEAAMLSSLDDPNPDVGASAVWYLRQTARVAVSTAIAVARHGFGPPRDHAAACYDFGSKLGAEALGDVLDALQAAEDDTTRCGLLGLAAGFEIASGEPGIERRLFTFVSALSEDGPVREVAAEYAGYGGIANGHEDHFARALVKQIGTSEEFDHNVALTLFNFYMGAHAVPQFALDAVGRLAADDSPQVQAIAAFAHTQLMSKPRR